MQNLNWISYGFTAHVELLHKQIEAKLYWYLRPLEVVAVQQLVAERINWLSCNTLFLQLSFLFYLNFMQLQLEISILISLLSLSSGSQFNCEMHSECTKGSSVIEMWEKICHVSIEQKVKLSELSLVFPGNWSHEPVEFSFLANLAWFRFVSCSFLFTLFALLGLQA